MENEPPTANKEPPTETYHQKSQPHTSCQKRPSVDSLVNIPKRARMDIQEKKPQRKQIKRTCQSLMQQSFRVNDLVWAYVRGFPYWPGVIEGITLKGKYTVHFFGDYTRSDIGRRNVISFYEGFEQYSNNFGNVKLQRAINKARILLLSEVNDECFVCKIPKV